MSDSPRTAIMLAVTTAALLVAAGIAYGAYLIAGAI